MQDNSEMAMEAAVLKRIILLLLGLADLAERLCGAPRPLRRYVLWILRAAEAVAQSIAYRHAPLSSACAPQLLRPAADTPDDAVHLAGRLRALAAALEKPYPNACKKWRAAVAWELDDDGMVTWPAPTVSRRPRVPDPSALQADAFVWDSS